MKDNSCPEGGIFGNHTWSQHGDDLFLMNCFFLLGIEKPSYLDIGAHHPTQISNTALMYSRGSRGINVEANPMLFREFLKQRPEDINVNVGVGVESGLKRFYILDDNSGLNSFCKEEIIRLEFEPRFYLNLNVITLKELIREHCNGSYPELLNTDIEGWDHDVLASADFSKTRPRIICAEIRPHASKNTIEMLDSKGYTLLTRIMGNLIFVRNEDYSKLKT